MDLHKLCQLSKEAAILTSLPGYEVAEARPAGDRPYDSREVAAIEEVKQILIVNATVYQNL